MTNPVASSLVWSLRPHSDNGGFITHGEGNGIFSYHVPGWSPPADPQFTVLEQYVVASTYSAAYQVLNEAVPFYPTPWQPTLLPFNTTNNGSALLSFVGGAWGEHYELYRAPSSSDGVWTEVENYLRDNMGAGSVNYTISEALYGDGNGSWVMRGVGTPPLLPKGPWSNVITMS